MDSIFYNLILALTNIILLTAFHLGVQGYFAALIAANTASLVLLIAVNKKDIKLEQSYISLSLLKRMLSYSLPLIFNSISWGIMGTADRMMLVSMINGDANGIYAAAARIPSLLSLVTGVFTQAWSLSAIQDFEEENDSRFYENVFTFTHISVTIGALVLLLCNNWFLPRLAEPG